MNKKRLVSLAAAAVGAMSVWGDAWVRVTDEGVLAAGDRVIIACPAKNVAAGELNVDNKYLKGVTTTFSEGGDVIASAGDAIVFTLGGEKGSWTLTDAQGRQLGASGTQSLEWDSYVHTWTIAVGADSLATIQSTSSKYGRLLYYVFGKRFTTYTVDVSRMYLLPTLYRKGYKEYKFTYEGYPERVTRCGDITYPEGKQIVLSAGQPTREGYTFAGWLYDGKVYLPGETFVMPEADVALVAQWTSNEATLQQEMQQKAMQERVR